MLNYYYFTNKKNNNKYRSLREKFVRDMMKKYSIKSGYKKRVADVVNNMLFNVVRCAEKGESEMTIMLKSNFFSNPKIVNGRECKINLSRTYFNLLLKYLQEKMLISLETGGNMLFVEFINEDGEVKYAPDKRKVSVMTLSDDFIAMVEGKSVDYFPENVIILRNSEKEDVEFVSTGAVEKQVEMLHSYNKLLDGVVFKDKDGRVINEPFLRRIYSGDFENGGRFYVERGIIQTMPSDERKLITIDGEGVVEVDVKCMHPAIIYTEMGFEMNFDPYMFELSYVENTERLSKWKNKHGDIDPERNFRKILMLVTLNCKSETEVVASMSQKLRKDKLLWGTDNEKDMKFVGLDYVDVHEAIEKMKDHNEPMNEYFHTSMGTRLQYKDSLFINKVLSMCLQDNIAVIPIHDSVVCKKSCVDKVEEIMRVSFVNTFGSDINLKLEVK